jgi:hypothetical protein
LIESLVLLKSLPARWLALFFAKDFVSRFSGLGAPLAGQVPGFRGEQRERIGFVTKWL